MPKLPAGCFVRQAGPPRPVDRHRMAPAAEFAGDDAKGHRHSVDLGREGFGDEGELHMSGGRAHPFAASFAAACDVRVPAG